MDSFMIIIYIVGAAWISNLLAWKLQFDLWIELKEKYLSMRLFNCSTCLSFWGSLIMNIIISGDFINSFMLASVISFIASLMEHHLCLFTDEK